MKHTKKLFAIALTLIMALALTVPAFAEGEITVKITGGNPNATYEAYKIMDLIRSGDNYNYTVDADYVDILAGADFANVDKTDKTAAAISNAIVEWVSEQDAAADTRAFAEDLMDAIVAGSIDEDFTTTDDTFALPQGYYLIVEVIKDELTEGEVRSLIMLDTATADDNNEINVAAKISGVTISKTVNGSEEYAIADYNEDVTFVIETNLPDNLDLFDGDITFVVTDTMDTSLTYTEDTFKVTVDGVELVDYEFAGFDEDGVAEIDISEYVTANAEDLSEAEVVIEYKASLNDTAARTEAQNNAVYATYSYDYRAPATTNDTVEVDVDVYTYGLDIVKYTNATGAAYAEGDTLLGGAVFELTNAAGKFAQVEEVEGSAGEYNFVAWVDESDDDTKMTTPSDGDNLGKISINGLGEDDYVLTELVAPAGYNLIDAPIDDVVIEDTAAAEATVPVVEEPAENVLNMSGSVLPSTGGIGTTIFYVVGALLMAGAGVLLVTKKRMADEE